MTIAEQLKTEGGCTMYPAQLARLIPFHWRKVGELSSTGRIKNGLHDTQSVHHSLHKGLLDQTGEEIGLDMIAADTQAEQHVLYRSDHRVRAGNVEKTLSVVGDILT